MNSTIAVLVPIATALIAALGGWMIKARQLSGKIATSEADELWAESRYMREDYRDQVARCHERVKELEDRIAKVEDLNNLLVIDNRALRARVTELEHELMEARGK